MSDRTTTLAAASIIVTVQLGLFVWLKADINQLAARVAAVEREVAFVKGQLSLALPALATRAPDPAS